MRKRLLVALLLVGGLCLTVRADADERLCDASVTNCRTTPGPDAGLLELINNETQGIDVGVWFFKDDRYVTALVEAKKRGVQMRMIMDPRANATYSTNAAALDKLAAAGIPMRKRIAGDIAHWKLMIFVGQGVAEWSGANFSPVAFVPQDPYKDYEDEVIYFSKALLPSFMTMFDNIWTNKVEYANYANVPPTLVRNYPTSPLDPRLNFPPRDSYQDRLIPLIDKEPKEGLIDVDMYRITLARPVDALIRAAARGVRIRMYLEPLEYANTARPGNKVQMDRLVAAAKQYPGTIELRMRKHLGVNHQKTVWLHAQHVVVFGTSNWSDASDDNQLEANIFTDRTFTDPAKNQLNDQLFSDLHAIFERKWHNTSPVGSVETEPWRTPVLPPPTNDKCLNSDATNYGGPAPCEFPPATTLPPGAKTVVMHASSGTIMGSRWQGLADSTAASNSAMWNPDLGQAKIAPALSAPPSYLAVNFSALKGVAYHMWVRMRAQGDSSLNDSVHIQFSATITQPNGTATMRYGSGSTSSAEFVLQRGPSGAAPAGWGWTDNGWGTPGNNIYFETDGPHTLHVQQREDGPIIDQIVLSPLDTEYLSQAPGSPRNDNTILTATESNSTPCSYTLSSSTGTVPSDGGSRTVTVTTQTGCAWTIDENVDWVTAPTGTTTGSGDASFTLAANTSTSSRSATFTIATRTYTLTQAAATAPSCTGTLSAASQNFTAAAGSGFVDVTADCAWSVTSNNNPSWLAVTSGNSGTGAGRVSYTIAENTGQARFATLTIAGQTYTVTQDAGQTSQAAGDIVLHPAEATVFFGNWQVNPDATAATGQSLLNVNNNLAKVSAASGNPASYFEMTFNAVPNTAYRVWIRGKATGNSWANDSVYIQFDKSVAADGVTAVYRSGTTNSTWYSVEDCRGCGLSGWGWQDAGGYGAGVSGSLIYFAEGPQTIRIQNREDGIAIDQIVISPFNYLSKSPGLPKDDTTKIP